MGCLEQLPGAGLVDALDGNAAEAQAGDFQAGLAQLYILHRVRLFLQYFDSVCIIANFGGISSPPPHLLIDKMFPVRYHYKYI